VQALRPLLLKVQRTITVLQVRLQHLLEAGWEMLLSEWALSVQPGRSRPVSVVWADVRDL